jgi:DNA-binding beta-propeller fold protein YncE
VLLAASLLAAVLLAGLASRPEQASANGVGDLYVATRSGVAEVLVGGGEVLATVALRDTPRALAFDPPGTTLYAATGGRALESVDIETLGTAAAVSLPGVAEALVHPSGNALVAAITGDRRLAVVDPAAGTTARTVELPGPADLLAADRRHPAVLAAESGKPWLALVAGTARPVTTTLAARVTAIAVSRAGELLVATRAPATVRRLAPTDLATEWSVDLPAAPDAVVALGDGIVAASGRTLWWVDRSGARTWRTLAAPATALAASDDGGVLYVATGSAVEAITADGTRSVRIAVDLAPGPGVLAPVPRPASLLAGGGSAAPGSGRAPATSTTVPADRPKPDVGLGIGVALLVLIGSLAIARRAVAGRPS